MGLIVAIVGVTDANGNRIDARRADGTRAPILLELGAGLEGSSSFIGDLTKVTITATATPSEITDAQHGDRGWLDPTSGNPMHPLATASVPGFLAAADFTKLGGIDSGAQKVRKVDYATAAVLPANTMSGGGTILTANANGALSVDGISPTVTRRILVKDEGVPAKNGWYSLTQTGDGSSPWILTRLTDADASSEIQTAALTFVDGGTDNANTLWALSTDGWPGGTVGTTALFFEPAGANLTTAVPSTIEPDAAASAGAAGTAARADHVHEIVTEEPIDVGTGNSEGVGTSFARGDHVHGLPEKWRNPVLDWPKDAADAAAGDNTSARPIHRSPVSKTAFTAYFTPNAALTSNDTNYATLLLERADGAGGAPVTVASVTTKTGGGGGTGDWAQNVPVSLGTLSNTVIAAGQIWIFSITKTAGGVVVPAGTLTIESVID